MRITREGNLNEFLNYTTTAFALTQTATATEIFSEKQFESTYVPERSKNTRKIRKYWKSIHVFGIIKLIWMKVNVYEKGKCLNVWIAEIHMKYTQTPVGIRWKRKLELWLGQRTLPTLCFCVFFGFPIFPIFYRNTRCFPFVDINMIFHIIF